MRIALFALLLWLLPAGAGSPLLAQDCSLRPLSPRVGGTIDPVERTYFNLFPDRDTFTSAQVYQCADSTALLVVSVRAPSGAQSTDTVTTRDESLDALARYIDQFERVYRNAERVAWNKIFAFARPVARMPRGAPLTVVTTDSTAYTGRLLHIDDGGLVLSNSSLARNAPFDPGAAHYVPAQRTGYFTTKQPFLQRLFAEQLFVPDGNPVRFKQHAVEILQSQTRYRRGMPPELRDYFRQSNTSHGAHANPASNAPLVRADYQRLLKTTFHLSLGTGQNLTVVNPATYSVILDFFDQNLGRQNVGYNFPAFILEADLDVTRRLRVGAHLGFSPPSSGTNTFRQETSSSGAQDALQDLGSATIDVSYAQGMVY